MKLKEIKIHKYKSIESDQTVEIEDDITVLVGMNESGKTAALESIAKTNYFQDDNKFLFYTTHDYPRREKKKMDKCGKTPKAITCTFQLTESEKNSIESDIGEGIIESDIFTVTTKYDNTDSWGTIKLNTSKFIEIKVEELGISSKAIIDKLTAIRNSEGMSNLIEEYKDEKYKESLKTLAPYFANKWKWSGTTPLEEYVTREHLKPNLPKYLYYDEYYSLPSRISIEKLDEAELEEEELKTAKALLELADLNTKEILEADDFEDFIAELEATEATISDELFEYWSTNKNLNIEFKIETVEKTEERNVRINQNQIGKAVDTHIVEHILDIRVKNSRTRVSLPLKNRSKGFNWFFSFLVWFKKIQEDRNSDYIILLDEPGLNLHASAQNDLLKFLENLSKNYQIIYTTHSPFMIHSNQLKRVRTVLETKEGTKISDSIQEKDPNTLFPLQAALGYDIAQNLYISEKNLLVEGVSDLIYLQTISGLLQEAGKESIRDDITIVPTGGLEKVATFISLLRGANLNIVCLLDSYSDPKGKAKMEKLIRDKIIHQKNIRYFDEFISQSKADFEDLFTKSDYLKLFNPAFGEFADISVGDLDSRIERIILQVNQKISRDNFNHYRPANQLAKMGVDISFFEEETINNFEGMVKEINKMFE